MLLCHVLFFFNDTATTEIYTLSLHDALPISATRAPAIAGALVVRGAPRRVGEPGRRQRGDRKSTRLNSSHVKISYAVFCLKKKKKNNKTTTHRHKRHIKSRSTVEVTERSNK